MSLPSRAEHGAPVVSRPLSIAHVLRQPPYLLPDDGVARAVGILRTVGDTAPVVDAHGRLVGALALRDLQPLLGEADDDRRLSGAIRAFIRQAPAVVSPHASVSDVREALQRTGETTAFVVDNHKVLLGAVSLADLLAPEPEPPRPLGAGGMATPWGVYLTSGTLQAGVANWVLAAGGVVMGLLLAASYLVVGIGLFLVQNATGSDVFSLWVGPQPVREPLAAVEWMALQSLALPVFVVAMRLTSLTRYHAAEHQAVHAIERGERLTPEALRRMPRVHPRCGTNLIVAALVFVSVAQAAAALASVGVDSLDGAAIGAMAAFLTWRRLGAFCQQHLTTRPAGEKHLASGIAAAMELGRRYVTEAPARPTVWRRIWCAGMPQTIVGVLLGVSAGSLASHWILAQLK